MTAPQPGWWFYDQWRAFPYTREDARSDDARLAGEIMVGRDHDGIVGEFRVRIYDFGRRSVHGRGPSLHSRLEAFADSWQILSDGYALSVLTGVDDHTVEAITERLVQAGFKDRTEALRGHHPVRCAVCKGTGYLDDVTPGAVLRR